MFCFYFPRYYLLLLYINPKSYIFTWTFILILDGTGGKLYGFLLTTDDGRSLGLDSAMRVVWIDRNDKILNLPQVFFYPDA